MKATRHRPDFLLFLVVILLSLIGLVSIYSASTILSFKQYDGDTNHYFLRQLFFVGIGLFAMLFTMNIHYQTWYRLSRPLLLLSYFLLGLVMLIGISVNGAKRWIGIGSFTFQPSELAMLAVIIYLSYLLTRKQDRIQEAKASFWPSVVLVGIGFVLIMLEPDMDTAVTFAMCPMILMFVAGVPFKYLRNLTLLGILVCVPLSLVGYRGDRIWSYWDPWKYIQSDGYQIIQSLYAIGSGGFLGRGLGHSIEKFSYLPEPHTDFIFAILSEEWGYIGGAFLIALYAILIWRGFYIATHVQDRFASLVAVGITSMMGIAVFTNIGSVTNLLPVIGVPLPFISYGGTSLLIKMFAMGMLLNISRYTVKESEIRNEIPKNALRSVHSAPVRTSRFDT
ncbi:MAG: putative lipid II flippase FtsW [Tumebacillaceae bacterium]